ncbi:3-deoxy-D-manno-octulosonic acid transferase [Paracoccus albus]|uniref:3-deoxy-D-manno-octulosonic acid transferase n=1 Tax=Paracoccus albus TaxID=3017784 RepID=UPI0022EFD890|nr:glycosyltransferase N-terminal domain-containing protein [Paracoccus albus]WBU60128.1 3-deoxy-D-manno-octulosonic acid transferase [Paracoccus albus]
MTAGGGPGGLLKRWLAKPARPQEPAPQLSLPTGDGPLVWMRIGAGYEPSPQDNASVPPTLIQLLVQMRRAGLQIAVSRAIGDPADIGTRGVSAIPDPGTGQDAAAAYLDAMKPDAVLLIGAELPRAILGAADQRDIPVIMAEARLTASQAGWSIPFFHRRSALTHLSLLLLPDHASCDVALDMGTPASRIEMTGPITQIREPLRHNEAEREALAEAFQGRQLWLAVTVNEAELDAVIEAHLTVLGYSHRAMLIMLPADPHLCGAMAEHMADAGLIVAQRSLDEDPTEEVNVYLADDVYELGLWYRLAPLCFMGTTLAGPTAAARDPFEAASLGSSIIHGPQQGAFAAEWAQLDGAQAARAIDEPAELSQAVIALLAPDQAAMLATNAWAVSTGGAGVATRIAHAIRDTITGEVA